jgi:hypothetical protein
MGEIILFPVKREPPADQPRRAIEMLEAAGRELRREIATRTEGEAMEWTHEQGEASPSLTPRQAFAIRFATWALIVGVTALAAGIS